MTKATAAQIIQVRNTLLAEVKTVRLSRNREMMRELVLKIRQLDGILEARARKSA